MYHWSYDLAMRRFTLPIVLFYYDLSLDGIWDNLNLNLIFNPLLHRHLPEPHQSFHSTELVCLSNPPHYMYIKTSRTEPITSLCLPVCIICVLCNAKMQCWWFVARMA